MSQARRMWHFKWSVIARGEEKIKCLLPIHCSALHKFTTWMTRSNWVIDDAWFWRHSGMFVCNKTAVAQSCSLDNAVWEALRLFPKFNVPEIKEKQNKCFILLLKSKDVLGMDLFQQPEKTCRFTNFLKLSVDWLNMTHKLMIMWNVTFIEFLSTTGFLSFLSYQSVWTF